MVYGDRVIDRITQRLRPTVDRGLAGWVVRHAEGVLVPDTSMDKRWLRRPDDEVSQTGAKSAICVPLKARDTVVGVLTVVHTHPDTFTNEHLELMQAIAGQAGVAVLNARLYDESQRQARVMTALAENAVAMNTLTNFDQALQQVMDQVAGALKAEAVLMGVLNENANELTYTVVSAQAAVQLTGLRQPLDDGLAWRTIRAGHSMVQPALSAETHTIYPGVSLKSAIAAPVRAHGNTLGVLVAINPADVLEDEGMIVLSGIGVLAGISITNARLYERLETAHKAYRELFEDSIDPILVTDWSGKVIEANRQSALTTGYAQEALKQMNILSLHRVENRLELNYDQLQNGETVAYESEVYRQVGESIPVEVYVRQVKMESSPQLQWILRDISERRTMETMQEDLIAMVYHDLRSPLSNVLSSLDIMRSMDIEEPDIAQLLGIAGRSANRMQRLVSSLLDIRVIESGQRITNQQAVDPHKLVGDAVEAVMLMVGGKQQVLAVAVDDGLPPVWANEDMIQRVLINLLENASKFTPVEGQIIIGAASTAEGVQFWVQDSGPGIAVADQDRIFEKFTRLKSTAQVKGLGLGLAFCRLAVQAHDGRIWVDNSLEVGSRFIFLLPVMAGAATPPQAAAS
jgi:PAS domain S-box-containing protein